MSIIASGRGLKTGYTGYVSNGYITLEMSGFPVDQRQANEPKIYEPEEILDMALYEAEDFVGDLNRLTRFQDMMFEFMDEVDENRKRQQIIHDIDKELWFRKSLGM